MASSKSEDFSSQCETNLSNEIDHLANQIKEKANTSRMACDNVLTSCDDWRTEELKRIDQIYQNYLRCIAIQQANFDQFCQKLRNDLKYNATQRIERVQKQESSNTQILDHVHQTVARVKHSVAQSQQHFTIQLPSDVEYSPSNFPSDCVSKDAMPQKISPELLSTDTVVLQQHVEHKQLVRKFSNTSSIIQSMADIDRYMIKCRWNWFYVVNAYLTAWYRGKNRLILDAHIPTIKKYHIYRKSDFDVLTGIQIFLFNHVPNESKNDVMNFLLQFFLQHGCIDQKLILDWYNNNDAHGHQGYKEAKQSARLFVELLGRSDDVRS